MDVASQLALCLFSFLMLELQVSIYVGYGDLNSGPLACRAGALAIEPSSQVTFLPSFPFFSLPSFRLISHHFLLSSLFLYREGGQLGRFSIRTQKLRRPKLGRERKEENWFHPKLKGERLNNREHVS